MGEASIGKTRWIERKLSVERALSKIDAATVVLALSFILTVGFVALDIYSHPHQGVADLERRKFLFEHLGQIAKHLGNFSFTAAASISAVFMKHISEFLTNNTIVRKLARAGSISVAAGTLALNGLVEVFRHNNDLVGDLSMAGLAFIVSTLYAELAISRLKRINSAS